MKKSATRSDLQPLLQKFAAIPTESTRRAFRGIFRFFLVNRVEMHCLMRFYAFLTGKLHASDARQRRSAKMEGDLTAQPPSKRRMFGVVAKTTIRPTRLIVISQNMGAIQCLNLSHRAQVTAGIKMRKCSERLRCGMCLGELCIGGLHDPTFIA